MSYVSQQDFEHARRAKNTLDDLIKRELAPVLRTVTRDPNLDVRSHAEISATQGKIVWLRIPWKLGETLEHDLSLCNKRDGNFLSLCPACRVLDEVHSDLWHESAHITEHSFQDLPGFERWKLVTDQFKDELDAMDPDRLKKVRETCVWAPSTLQGMKVVDKWMLLSWNVIEDIYVNRRLVQARPGVEPSLVGTTRRAFIDGISDEFGNPVDRGSDLDALMVPYLMGHGLTDDVEVKNYFDADHLRLFEDADLKQIVDEIPDLGGIDVRFGLAMRLIQRLRELGYLPRSQDSMMPPPPPPSESGQESEPQPGSGTEEQQEQQSSDSESSEGEPDDESESEEGSDEAEGQPDDESESEEGDGESEDDANGAGADEAESEESEDDDEGGEGEGSSEEDGSEAEADESESEEESGDGGSEPSEDESEEGDDQNGEASDGDTDSDEADDGESEDGEQGGSDSDAEGLTDDEIEAMVDELEKMMTNLMGHGEDESLTREQQQAIEKAEKQCMFDEPSDTIESLEVENDPYQNFFTANYSQREMFRQEMEHVDVKEALIVKPLSHLRIVFAENHKIGLSRDLRRGPRLDVRHLHRIGNDDFRVFARRDVPIRRDWEVVVGLDFTSSNNSNGALRPMKEAAMAVCEMLSRLGIKFHLEAHTSSGSRVLHYQLKTFNEPWGHSVKEDLDGMIGKGRNRDGHSLERYRKLIEGERATDKLIMYFTDGEMHGDPEQLKILEREIDICRKQRIHLLGVGYQTDSPAQLGLTTIQYESGEDVAGIVAGLDKYLSQH